jgi:hypothetical protein
MTRKTNFFHSHRGVAALPLRTTSNQPVQPTPPVAPSPEAEAIVTEGFPERRPWWAMLSEPRRRRRPGGEGGQ